MKKLTLLLVFIICAVTTEAQDLSVRMDEILRQPGRKWFMGSILVARDGRVLFEKSYGSADLKQHLPNTAATRFRIGSLTKQFTAASILLLEERGKLRTDDLVNQYLADAPAAWSKITIYHLLTHTSGIPDYVNSTDFDAVKTKACTPESLLQAFRDKPLEFEPGMQESYSSSNYVVLGYLIEKIAGQSYAQFLETNIFRRLGMKDSGVEAGTTVIRQLASGYSLDHGQLVGADYINMSSTYAAGAVYSTVEDLLRWEQGLVGGKLLAAHALNKMTTPFLSGYACGLHVEELSGRKVIFHSGRIDGFSAYLAYYPQDKLVIIALSNVWNREMATIAAQLAAVAQGHQMYSSQSPGASYRPGFGKGLALELLDPDWKARYFEAL